MTAKFKIGDKLKRVRGGTYGKMTEGSVGIVSMINQDNEIEFDGCQMWRYHGDFYELVEEKEEMTNKFVRAAFYIGGDKELSEAVQKKLFEMGYFWRNTGRGVFDVEYPYITTDVNGCIYQSPTTYGCENIAVEINTHRTLNVSFTMPSPEDIERKEKLERIAKIEAELAALKNSL